MQTDAQAVPPLGGKSLACRSTAGAVHRVKRPRMDPVPALGEHTDAILAELGYGAHGIAALRAAKAI